MKRKRTTDSLGARIRAERKARGLTQPEFAEFLGVSLRTFCGWERGEHEPRGLQLRGVEKAIQEKA